MIEILQFLKLNFHNSQKLQYEITHTHIIFEYINPIIKRNGLAPSTPHYYHIHIIINNNNNKH